MDNCVMIIANRYSFTGRALIFLSLFIPQCGIVCQSHGGLAPGAGEWVHMERIQEILSCLNKKEGLTVIIVKLVMNIVD